jgi:hypothetical protein
MTNPILKEFKEKYKELNGFIQGKRDDSCAGKLARYFIMSDYPRKFIDEVKETPLGLTNKLFQAKEVYSKYSKIGRKTEARFEVLRRAHEGQDYKPLLEKLKRESGDAYRKDFLSDLRYRIVFSELFN